MCFFLHANNKTSNFAAELTVLHWDLGLRTNGALRCQWQAAFETLDSLDSPDLSRGDDGNQVTAQRCLSGMICLVAVLAVFFGANKSQGMQKSCETMN